MRSLVVKTGVYQVLRRVEDIWCSLRELQHQIRIEGIESPLNTSRIATQSHSVSSRVSSTIGSGEISPLFTNHAFSAGGVAADVANTGANVPHLGWYYFGTPP